MDITIECRSCGRRFVWTHDEQIEAFRAGPLDEDLDPTARPRAADPPKECPACRGKGGKA